MTAITLTVNGQAVWVEVEPRTSLAEFLREQQHLAGPHLACEHGVCGACTVLLNGVPARACIAYAVALDGGDHREICAALAIHVLDSWRCRSPGARSAVWLGSRATCVRSCLFRDFATGLGRGVRFDASHRAPSAPCHTIASRSRTLTIPITTARTAVQSNEVYPPPSPPRQDSTLRRRRINAIR